MPTKMKPILFSTAMVKAIFEGRKTQTRRITKLQPGEGEYYKNIEGIGYAYISKGGISGPYECPFGKVGDVLWVRETFMELTKGYAYKADGFLKEKHPMVKWKPSLFMPYAACRIFLRIKSIKCEQLQSITDVDAIAEGIESKDGKYKDYYRPIAIDDFDFKHEIPRISFLSLWTSINGIDSWIANPWVWVIEFEHCEKPTT